MSRILRRRILGPITLLHMMMIAVVSIAFGTVLLYYDWTMTLTAAFPDVRFRRWSDSTEYNKLTMSHNFYADVWMIDDNATYGIRNSAASPKTVYLWVESCSDPATIANYTVQILEDTGSVLCTWTTTDFANAGEGSAVSWTAGAEGIDTIKVIVRGASLVSNVSIELRLKTDA